MSFLTGQLVKNILNLGVLMTPRPALNFLGTGWSMVDNPGNNSTDVTFTPGSTGAFGLWLPNSAISSSAFIQLGNVQVGLGPSASPGQVYMWMLPLLTAPTTSNWTLNTDGSGDPVINSTGGVITLLFNTGNTGTFGWSADPGTVNSQQITSVERVGTARTVSSATPTAILSISMITGTGGILTIRAMSRAVTSGAGIAVDDTAVSTWVLGYKNHGGTVSLSSAGITQVGTGQTTAAALVAPTITASASTSNVNLLVTNVALCTIDSQINVRHDYI